MATCAARGAAGRVDERMDGGAESGADEVGDADTDIDGDAGNWGDASSDEESEVTAASPALPFPSPSRRPLPCARPPVPAPATPLRPRLFARPSSQDEECAPKSLREGKIEPERLHRALRFVLSKWHLEGIRMRGRRTYGSQCHVFGVGFGKSRSARTFQGCAPPS